MIDHKKFKKDKINNQKIKSVLIQKYKFKWFDQLNHISYLIKLYKYKKN